MDETGIGSVRVIHTEGDADARWSGPRATVGRVGRARCKGMVWDQVREEYGEEVMTRELQAFGRRVGELGVCGGTRKVT